MTFDPFDTRPTSRRWFVLDVVGGLASTVLVTGCGSTELTQTARTGGAGGGGAAPPGSGGATPDASGGGDGGHATGGVVNGASGGFSGSGSGGVSGSGSGGASGSATGGASGSATGGVPGEAGACALYPQQMEGPFYLDLDLLRTDITEGKAGAPLELDLKVISANGCTPIANAIVDVWQCDAVGVYGGFPGQLGGLDTTGQKFLRGTQITGPDGRVVFRTIYPGWYPGRTTHIHFKVHLSATSEVTSQIYFPEDVTASVYQTAPYAAHGPKDTSNQADAIARTGGMPPVLLVTPAASGYRATLALTVLG
jgi:protocatechuate 3,4-dioxygenase beta subunit